MAVVRSGLSVLLLVWEHLIANCSDLLSMCLGGISADVLESGLGCYA